MPRKKLIAVITDSMDGEYEKRIGEQLSRSSVEHHVTLIFFCASDKVPMKATTGRTQTIYDLVVPGLLDGVILVLSSMVHTFEEDVLERLLTHVRHMPLVSLSVPLDNAYNVLLDNRSAMKTLFEHMMTHTAFEEICYIAGPDYNYEAVERNNVFKEMCRAREIPLDKKRYYEGDFEKPSGGMAVEQFLKARGRIPRAIVSANDEMAISAYEYITNLGYTVPEDCIISGFDNIDSSNDFFPPITTYEQNLEAICDEAMKGIVGLLKGTLKPMTLETKGWLVIRESCGCLNLGEEMPEVFQSPTAEEANDWEAAVRGLRERLEGQAKGELVNIIKRTAIPLVRESEKIDAIAEELINSLIEDLMLRRHDSMFLRNLNRLINKAIISGVISDLSNLSFDMRKHLMSRTSSEALRRQIELLLNVADRIVNSGLRRQERYYQLSFRQMYMMSRTFIRDLNNIMSQEEIFRILTESLPHYGISSCYIVFYKRPVEYLGKGEFNYPKMSDMVFGYEDGRLLPKQSFVTRNILPTQIIYGSMQHRLLLLPLFSGRTHYGYISFSMDGIDPLIYETVRSQISEALKRQQMNRKRLEAEKALNNVLRELEMSNELLRWQSVRDELTGLYNRRGFYKEAETYFHKAIEVKEPFWFIFGDIDGLKQINDVYGHKEGDFAINKIGETLTKEMPRDAIVARVSGDEYNILIKNEADEKTIKGYVKAVEKRLKKFNGKSRKPYALKISLGYASYDYETLGTMDELLIQADANLYRAKARNKQ